MRIEGFEVQKPVQSGRATYWGLCGNDQPVGFVGDVVLAKDHNYGSMSFRGRNGQPVIAPWGMTFFMGGAQDRSLRRPVWINVGETVRVETLCVEPAQGGLWQGQKTKVGQLPPSLLASMPAGGNFSALWDSIRRRANAGGKRGEETVVGLLEGRSVATVDNESWRGVIAAIDGRPVAVCIAPTRSAFATWWHEHGLGLTLEFEATTLPSLPLPLGEGQSTPIAPCAEGLHQVQAWQVLVGWMAVFQGQIAYASLVDGEALVMFNQRTTASDDPITPLDEWEV